MKTLNVTRLVRTCLDSHWLIVLPASNGCLSASLCFLEAFRAKQNGDITEEEYVHHLFAHCQGVEHDGDDLMEEDWDLLENDLFGYSVRAWSLRMDHVKDATPFEDVLKAYRTGKVEELKASLDQLSDEHANYARESLAVLALQDRRSTILKLCLDQGGFAFEHYFDDAANKFQNASDDPDTCRVLEESKFRKMYPLLVPRDELDSGEGSGGEEEDPSKVFDRGGRLPVNW